MSTCKPETPGEFLSNSETLQGLLPLLEYKETASYTESPGERDFGQLPPVFLRERSSEEGIEAVSGMKLVGVAWCSRRSESERDRVGPERTCLLNEAFRALLSTIQEDQRLNLVFRTQQSFGLAPAFDWSLVSRFKSETADDAKTKSNHFWRDMNVLAQGSLSCYRFGPLITEAELEPQCDLPFRTRIRPAGVSLSIVGPSIMGFILPSNTNDNELNRRLLVPYETGAVETPAHGAIRGVWNAQQVIEIASSFTRFTLPPSGRRLVARALDWINSDPRKNIRYEDQVIIEHETTLDSISRKLENWCRDSRGYAMSCFLRSDQPIPPQLIRRIASEVFPGRPFDVHHEVDDDIVTLSQTSVGVGVDILDLRDSFSALDSTPFFLPDPAALRDFGVTRFYPAPKVDLSAEGVLLGRVDRGGRRCDVRLSRRDRECHVALMGSTGVGKSTALASLVKHSIQNNEGLVLIDPHGQLYTQALKFVPTSRRNEVVLIDFTDLDHSVGINFLECHGTHRQTQMNFITNEMIKIFDRLYDLRQTGGPMFETYMRNALLLVMDNEIEGGTLVDIPWLFEDSDVRKFLLGHCRSHYVKSFWNKQAEKAGGELALANMGPYITSKLNQFTQNAVTRAVIGQSKSTINFREILDRGKILLVNLSKGALSELDARLLGMLIMGKLFGAAMERAACNNGDPRRSFLVIDEFATVATDTAAYMLSESRKFGLNMTMAFQNLAQLNANGGKQDLLESTLGNVGSLIFFRLGPMDAQKLAAYTHPYFEAEDLQDLPNYHAVARLLVNNCPQRPFVFKTSPAEVNASRGEVDRIITKSRARYNVPVSIVEEQILKRREALCAGDRE